LGVCRLQEGQFSSLSLPPRFNWKRVLESGIACIGIIGTDSNLRSRNFVVGEWEIGISTLGTNRLILRGVDVSAYPWVQRSAVIRVRHCD
jgi:hypothetical protein